MVRLTNSEVDCVINAARPLDGSARDAFLREVASALGSCPAIGDDVVHRVVAESRRDIFGHLNLAHDKPDSRVASTAELVHFGGPSPNSQGSYGSHSFRSRGENVSDALTRRKGA
jgi:hypothetical protein